MVYSVLLSQDCIHDLELIFDYLFDGYIGFGDTVEEACQRAEKRIEAIQQEMEHLSEVPHQGTLRPELMSGLRNVTKDQAVFYFKVDDEREEIRILAVFFGGQDHQRHMLVRLLSKH